MRISDWSSDVCSSDLNFIGIHFFSPVDKMQLVEIIVGKRTSQETLAKAMDYVKQIRKTPIVVNDSRGLYTSRCFGTYVAEGLAMLAEGKIGRASGRERGCPSVEISVASESLKKKELKETLKQI